jgi:hypothetical protein
MSGNRANVAARNRRAGGVEIAPPQQSINNRQKNVQSQNQAPPKISISDAIGLVTLRLGRLETFVNTINHEGLPANANFELGENEHLVDGNVFDSIVSRIDSLENQISSLKSNNNSTDNSMSNIENIPVIKSMIDKQNTLQLSIYEVKDMILKLQAFSMETSINLKNLTEKYEADKLVTYQNDTLYNNDSEPTEVIEDTSLINSESLKDFIAKELTEEE